MTSTDVLTEQVFEKQTKYPVLICVLGRVRVLKWGTAINLKAGSKMEALLSILALYHQRTVERNVLLFTLWPESNASLAGQCLNSLTHNLHKLLGDALGHSAPVIRRDGNYCLNLAAGIGVDSACFDAVADDGDQARNSSDIATAVRCYQQAVSLYHGDLMIGAEASGLVEQERLRARYLHLLQYLAKVCYSIGDDQAALRYALTILQTDPCREDAHRLAMSCYMRRGERAQALRQYQLCERLLQLEFSACPEAATHALYEQLRLHPEQFTADPR